MSTAVGRMADRRDVVGRPAASVTLVGVLVAVMCLGFAGANVALMMGSHITGDAYARVAAGYAAGLAMVNVLVIVLKVIGAAAALASVSRRPWPRPGTVGVVVWGAFSTLAVYVLGSLVEASVFLVGGQADRISLASVGYVAFFLVFAAGFGVLAVSYTRRWALRGRHILLGLLAAPVVLGLVLLVVPALLGAAGMVPTG